MTPPALLSRFEANLIRILRFFLRSGSEAEALPLLFQRCARPSCLSKAAVRIIEDTLAKGCIRLLARAEGGRPRRFLRDHQVVEGHLWQRSTPQDLALHFSRYTLDLLLWFTAFDPSEPKARRRKPPPGSLSAADALLCYHVYTALRTTKARPALTRGLGFGTQALCWLAYPDDFVNRPAEEQPDFALWTHGLGATLLEALQGELAENWVAVERSKKTITEWPAMQALGTAQERVLDAFIAAINRAGRRDLARFLLAALDQLLPQGVTHAAWVGELVDPGKRLADREVTYRKALALPRQLEGLRQWERDARMVGYFDEDYAACQFWKAEWEHWQGELLCQRAESLLREVDSFTRQEAR